MDDSRVIPDYFKNILGKLELKYKYTFFTGLVVGILVHFLMISNKITNLDDIVCVPGVGGGKVLGRWFQEPVHDLFSPWSSPALNGIMSIIILSIAACVIVSVLDIKSITGAVLVPVIMMTLPSTASNMYYMYLAPTFALAILASTLNVYLIIKYKFGWILGAVLQFFSMACYQAYFGLATSLLVLAFIIKLIDGNKVDSVVRCGIRSLVGLIIAMGGYIISLKFIDLSDYKGLDNIGGSSITDIIYAVLRAYHRVIQYFVTSPESFMAYAPTYINIILVGLCLIALVILMIKKKVFTEISRGIILIILLGIFPLALGLVYVMAPELSHASTVMIYSYSAFYFMLIAFAERLMQMPDRNKLCGIISALIVIALISESYACGRVVNNAYYRSYIAQRRTEQYYNRIIVKLEETEGYQYGDPFVILGGFYPNPVPIASHNMNGKQLADFEGATYEDLLFLPNERERFIQIYLGVETGDIMSVEDKGKLMETEEFKNMPSFPADGCVQKIDGIWVLKIAENDG
ncbi:glucosyltransferase domain-containing protein [Butyrivibrio sp. AE3006]|uniref:glucosyltransferase domain-containing protein n=1 Tax=Butyrivibrio sp. AE3006 TaxID=1280673 RepID=UPI0004023445|nr:glucosyltransferase domain-containing protein [Butyrivibrio sp. AE3006]